MNTILKTTVFGVLCAILVTACGDKEKSNPNNNSNYVDEFTPNGVDEQGRPVFLCTGEYCYDPDAPENIEKRKDSENYWFNLFSSVDDGTDPTFLEEAMQPIYEILEEKDRSYRSCRYQMDINVGFLAVDCPDWALGECPQDFFNIFPTDSSRHVVPIGANPARFYCLPDTGVSGEYCAANFACPNGEVCSGALTTTMSTAETVGGTLLRCLPAESCVALAERYGATGEQSCFYSDFSPVRTPVVPDPKADCSALPTGMCSHSCNCAAVPMDPLNDNLEPSSCMMLSEKNLSGVCVPSTCEFDAECWMTLGLAGVCAKQKNLPSWAEAHYNWLDKITGPFRPMSAPGLCVMQDACAAWNARNGEQLVCGSGSYKDYDEEEEYVEPPYIDDTEERIADLLENLPKEEDLEVWRALGSVPCDASAPDALCYDRDRFEAENESRLEDYRVYLRDFFTEGHSYDAEVMAEVEHAVEITMETLHLAISKCNYYRDEFGRVRVACHEDAAGLFYCPHMWFLLGMERVGGIRFRPGEDPVCFEELTNHWPSRCEDPLASCEVGKVCSGRYSFLMPYDPEDDRWEGDPNFWIYPDAVCLEPEVCLELRDGQKLNPQKSCIRSDGTPLPSAP